MIPRSMKINKTSSEPSKGLIRAIIKKCSPVAKKSLRLGIDYCEMDGLFVAIEWAKFPLSRLLRCWNCVSVDVVGRPVHSDYRLVQYRDFTRVYYPGSWEASFLSN